MLRRWSCVVVLAATACSAQVGDVAQDAGNNSESDGSSSPVDGATRVDGSTSVDAGDAGPTAQCDELRPALEFFQRSCGASGACHVQGGQFPNLRVSDLSGLLVASRSQPAEQLVVPGDPAASWLYRKISGTQGANGGSLMPIGASQPIEGIESIQTWIANGAPTQCPDPPPVVDVPRDPNTLDQNELFTCVDPVTSSPARVRRLERTQWTHSAAYNLNHTTYDNPLFAPEGRFTTFTDGVGMDSSTLDLYMTLLPQAAAVWSERSGGTRTVSVYDDRNLRCIFNDAAPDEPCMDYYVDKLLRRGTLFRAPTDDERSRLKVFLVAELATETAVAERPETLKQVASAAWMMSGALFRADLGEPDASDPAGRRRLSNDELALALGDVLSTHPPGSSIPWTASRRPGPPDSDNPDKGWLGLVRDAADDGSIQQPTVLQSLLQTYRAGVDPSRADIAFDNDSRDLPARGEYWLAPRIAGFFREWLDYQNGDSAFKDTPGATSAYEGRRLVENGFRNLQGSYYGYESTLVRQLDDTIARAVIDAENQNEDVLLSLMTTRMWRLPSNLAMSGNVTCTSDADCTNAGGNTRCQDAVGLCSNSSSNNVVTMPWVYGIDAHVPATPEGRWVDMPATERAGVLTHPAWLVAHGGNFEDDASAVHRGKWIREKMFCETVPGLELVMVEAQLVPSAPNLRARDRIRMSIEEGENAGTCMGCHRLMNPLGLPFEEFNHAGYRRADDHGQAPDGSSIIDNAPDANLNTQITGAIQLSALLGQSPHVRRCFVRQAFRYFMGRNERLADACTLSQMETAFANGSFFALLDALVTSDAFVYRTVEAP